MMSAAAIGTTHVDSVARPISIEQALVARAHKGDPRAFRMIFDRNVTTVRRFLLDLLRDATVADEATQETFVRAHRALPNLRDGTKLRSWLLGIARNVFHERLRAHKRRGYTTEFTDEIAIELGTVPSPEEQLLRHEADEMLGRALQTISEERRAALLLRLDHGLGYGEIAEAMDWNLAKVKNEIHRARLQLRASLAKYLGGTS